MENQFDPYRDWLHIAPASRLPTHYELLGLPPFNDDPQQAHAAASERIAHVRKWQAGKHSDVAIRLMHEISQALTCLCDPAAKAAYDRNLRGFATVEDAAAEALSKTVADAPHSDLEGMPPLPPDLAGAGGKAFEKLSAAVDAMQPLPGAAAYVDAATPHRSSHATPGQSRSRLPIAAALAIVLLVSLAGMYGLYQVVTDAGGTHDEQVVLNVPDIRPPPEPTVPADPISQPGAAAQTPQPMPPANGTPLAAPPRSSAPIGASPGTPSQSLLPPGMHGSWDGSLAEIYIDPLQQQVHLLLKLDAPPHETVEAISNDRAAYLALFAFVSDSESGGKGDRLHIEGTVMDGGPALFSQRTQPQVVQLTSLGPIGGPATYRAGAAPAGTAPLKLKAPLSFLMRMRPEPGQTYEFPAVFQSAIEDRERGGAKVRITPGSPDEREITASFPDVTAFRLRIFRPGDPVLLQAAVTTDEPPPKLGLRILRMRRTEGPKIWVGSPQIGLVNVELNMQTASTAGAALGGLSGAGRAPPGMSAPLPGMATSSMGPTVVLPGSAAPLLTLKDGRTSLASNNVFYRLAWSSDGTCIAGGGRTCTVWDARSGGIVRTLLENVGPTGELRFSPLSLMLSIVNSSSQWKLYDQDAGTAMASRALTGNANGFRTAFTPGGDVFIAGAMSAVQVPAPVFGGPSSNDIPVLIWDTGKNRQVGSDIKNLTGVQAISLSSDGRYLLVGTMQSLGFFKHTGGELTAPQTVASVIGIQALWWLGGSQYHFAALTSSNQLGVWDARYPKKPAFFSANNVQLPVSWTSDGKRLVSVVQGAPTVQTVVANSKAMNNPAARQRPDPLAMPMANPLIGNCQFAAFSPVNYCLALGHSDGRVVLRNEDTDGELVTFMGPGPLTSLAWSPRGDRLASAHLGAICIWDTSKFTDPAQFKEPPEAPEVPQSAAPAAALRDEVATQIKAAQKAIIDKDWATANSIWQQLESDAELNAAERIAVSSRIKKALTSKAELLIQQANRLKAQDPDKAAALLSEAMEIDPEGAGKKAAKALGL